MSEPTEEARLTANAKYLGDICAYPWDEKGHPGMTIRQVFAAMAMQGLVTNNGTVGDIGAPHTIAIRAVEVADALLKELAK